MSEDPVRCKPNSPKPREVSPQEGSAVRIANGRDTSGLAAADVRKLGEAVADIAEALQRLTEEVERDSKRDGVPLGKRVRR